MNMINAAGLWHNGSAQDLRLDGPLTRTVRIPFHKGRLALLAFAGLAAAVICIAILVFAALGKFPGPVRASNFFGPAIGVVFGIFGWLRGMSRLQNSDDGLIVGPRGLSIQTDALGRRIGLIPWQAIARFEQRKHKGRPYIAVHLRDQDRLLPERGAFGRLAYRMRAQISGSPVTIASRWLRISTNDLAALLQRYLEHHGRNDA